MLIHQVTQDMLQESNLIKMMVLTQMLVKEITLLRKTLLKLNQLSQIAMEAMVFQRLTACKENKLQCAQETNYQRHRKVKKLTAEFYQYAMHKMIKLSHQLAIEPDK